MFILIDIWAGMILLRTSSWNLKICGTCSISDTCKVSISLVWFCPKIGKICEYNDAAATKNFFRKLIEEGNFDVSYQCLREFQYRHADAGQSIIKYGDIGSTFYIIVKGSVDVYTPIEVKVNLNVLELAKLINEYSDMVIEVNNSANFSMPYLTAEQKQGIA